MGAGRKCARGLILRELGAVLGATCDPSQSVAELLHPNPPHRTQTYTYDTLNTGTGFADVQRNLGDSLAGVIFGVLGWTLMEG